MEAAIKQVLKEAGNCYLMNQGILPNFGRFSAISFRYQTSPNEQPNAINALIMREIQFREALREAMTEEMRRDPQVYLMGEEVAEYNGAYKVSQGMLDEFGPERVIDTPIAELGFAGIGVGSAINGLRPIIEFMTFNFSLVAIDQVINSAAKIMSMSGGQYSCPIVFRGPTGNAGMLSSQHSQNFENWFANTSGLKVVVPSNPYDAKGLLKSCIRDNDPVIFMESELMYGDKGQVPEEEYLIPIGLANVVREGNDVTIVSFGKIMKVALAGRRRTGEKRRFGRSYRPTLGSPDRLCYHYQLGEENEPVCYC